jgi:hypothetical protein
MFKVRANQSESSYSLVRSGDLFHHSLCVLGSRKRSQSSPFWNRELIARMNSAIGIHITHGNMVIAKMILNHAAAGHLFRAGEPRPVNQKSLATYSATNIATSVRERTTNLFHLRTPSNSRTRPWLVCRVLFRKVFLGTTLRHSTKAVSPKGKGAPWHRGHWCPRGKVNMLVWSN